MLKPKAGVQRRRCGNRNGSNRGLCAATPVMLALVVHAASVHAATPPYIIRDPAKLPPPARPWALPDKNPPIRALVICPWGATRDVYALAAHMKLDFDLIETATDSRIDFGEDRSGRIDQPSRQHTSRRVIPALKTKYDVIVLASFHLAALSGEAKYCLVKQVTEGSGLVLFNQDWKMLGDLYRPLVANSLGRGAALVRGVPWQAFRYVIEKAINRYPGVRYWGDSEFTRSALFKRERDFDRAVGRYRVGHGRLATVSYGRARIPRKSPSLTPATAYPLDRLWQYDDYLSIAAKQVRWAARGEPKVSLWDIAPNATHVPRTPGRPMPASVTLRNQAGVRGPIQLRVVARDADGRVEHEATQEGSLSKPEQSFPLSLPALADGEHWLDVQVLRNGSVADWGSSHFTVTSAMRVAGVELETDVLRQGDTIRGAVTLEGIGRPLSLETRVWDSYDRVEALRRVRVTPGQTDQTFALSLPDHQGIIFRVEALLREGREVISRGHAAFTIPKNITEKRWLAIGWSGPLPRPGMIQQYRLLRRYGYEIILSAFSRESQARAAAWCDQISIPYMIRLMSCDAKTCYTSEKWRREMAEGLEAHARMISKYGALGYSLGDEVRLNRYACEQPTCVAAFQDWLRRTYKTAGALNAEWGSHFKNFNQVRTSYVSEAKQKQNYAPAVDYLSHRRDLWVETCRFCYDAIQRGDPGARMGYEGARGYERWPELLEFFRIAGPYNWRDNDIVFDQHKPDTVIGNWIGNYGYDMPDDHARHYTWDRLLQGCNSQWWWTLVMAFHGDNTPVRRFAVNTQELAAVNAGLGKLVINSEMVHDPIVLPHCPPSELVSQFYSELTSIQASKDAMRDILQELSLRHWRIPMKRIAAGELERDGHKVVLLPYHQAMCAKAAQALTRFVAAGGLLVADLRPAIMDEHGRVLDKGLLDEVFGVERRAVDGKAIVRGRPHMNGTALGGLTMELRADRTVVARPGAEVGGTVEGVPICITHRVGKGRAVLLNFAMDEYFDARSAGAAWPFQKLFSRLLADAGVEPTVRVTAGDGQQPFDGVRVTRWRNGSMTILGLDRIAIDPKRDGPAKLLIRWPEPGYVYDLRARRCLGRRDTVETELAIYAPHLYAWLPYEIRDVKLEAPRAAQAGERLPITVRLIAPRHAKTAQVVCLDVYAPDGSWRYYHRQRLRFAEGEAATHIALAHNAPPGRWKLVAADVVSGLRCERAFQVTAPTPAAEGGE